MKTYEVWLTESAASMTTKIVTVEAKSERDAFHKANEQCKATEFVRGVIEIERGDSLVDLFAERS